MTAPAVVVSGLASIKIDGTLLGYTRDGTEVTMEGHTINVPGDQNGGDDGPPIDIQDLGSTARVRCEFTKWDTTIGTRLEARFKGQTAGVPTPAGSLVFAGSGFFRLTVASPSYPRNFPCAVLVRTPQTINMGTKFSRYIVEFECYKHPTTGVLYDGNVT